MIMDLLRTRRSIRKFSDRAIENEKLDLLIEAALRSPSAVNRNPWEFVVVADREKLRQLSTAKENGSSFVKDAALAIVVCAHPDRSDVWVEDASIAALLIHLTATDLGLGSCWVQLRLRRTDDDRSSEEYVSELLGLEKGMAVEALVAIGYPAEVKPCHPTPSLPYNRVHFNEYGMSS